MFLGSVASGLDIERKGSIQKTFGKMGKGMLKKLSVTPVEDQSNEEPEVYEERKELVEREEEEPLTDSDEEREAKEGEMLLARGDDEDIGPVVKRVKGADEKSQYSTNTSINTKYPNARELSETFQTKIREMSWVFVSLIVNGLLIIFQINMSTGINIPVPISIIEVLGILLLEILFLLANIITIQALDDSFAAYFGSRIASKQGYSVAVCGFYQASSLGKSGFCSSLSLNSKCRKLLGRMSIMWTILELLKGIYTTLLISLTTFSLNTDCCNWIDIDHGPLRSWNCIVY